jgi:hypothetical protein
MAKWIDETSYSRGDNERLPRVWAMQIGDLRILVHRYVGCEGWHLTTHPDFVRNVPLKSESSELAQQQALTIVKDKISGIWEKLETL